MLQFVPVLHLSSFRNTDYRPAVADVQLAPHQVVASETCKERIELRRESEIHVLYNGCTVSETFQMIFIQWHRSESQKGCFDTCSEIWLQDTTN